MLPAGHVPTMYMLAHAPPSIDCTRPSVVWSGFRVQGLGSLVPTHAQSSSSMSSTMMPSTSFASASSRSLRLPIVSRSAAPTTARAQQQRVQRAVGVCGVSREGLDAEDGACSASSSARGSMPQSAVEQPGAMMMLKASLMGLDGAAGAGVFTAAALVAFGLLAMAAPAMAHADHLASDGAQRVLGDLAEGDEPLLVNVARYGKYFVTVMLGTGYVIAKPVVAMFKVRPGNDPRRACAVLGSTAAACVVVLACMHPACTMLGAHASMRVQWWWKSQQVACSRPHAASSKLDGVLEGPPPPCSRIVLTGFPHPRVTRPSPSACARSQNPVSGIFALLAIGISVVGTKVTIEAMLGMSNVPTTPYDW
jgi:hypothetical protein